MVRRSKLIAFVAALFLAATSANSAEIPHGIYLILPPGNVAPSKMIERALKHSYINGVFIRLRWKDIEPSHGLFDWTFADRLISEAAKEGKTVSLAVAAGIFTPDWVYSEDVQPFHTNADLGAPAHLCASVNLPVPWDRNFLKLWKAVVDEFGRHFSGNTSVSLIKFGGINYKTWEMLLPTHGAILPAGTNKFGCNIPNEADEWLQLGYTNTQMLDAFSYMSDAYSKAFPTTPIAFMTGTNGFPPDSSGRVLELPALYDVAYQILGARIVAQDNALTDAYVAPEVVTRAQAGWRTGLQFAVPITDNMMCNYAEHKHCEIPSVFWETAMKAIRSGACYIEVFPKDVVNNDLQAQFMTVSTKLAENCKASHQK